MPLGISSIMKIQSSTINFEKWTLVKILQSTGMKVQFLSSTLNLEPPNLA